MKVFWIIPLLILAVHCSGQAQNDPSNSDPIYQSARQALYDGRIADAKKIVDQRISDIERRQNNSPDLVPYLDLRVGISSYLKDDVSHATYEQILRIESSAFGPADERSLGDLIDVAESLGRGEVEQEEQLLKQARDLALQNPKLEPETVAIALTHLSDFYTFQERLPEAMTAAEPAVPICAREQRISSPCAGLREQLAGIYQRIGRPELAEELLKKNIGAEFYPPELRAFESAAHRYMSEGLYVEAEWNSRKAAEWIRAHPVWSKDWGSREMTGYLPIYYTEIGEALEKQGLNDQAEEQYKEAIALYVEDAPFVALQNDAYKGLLSIYRKTGRLNEADPIVSDVIAKQEKKYGESSNFVAESQAGLAQLSREEKKYLQAERAYEQALKIYDANLGPKSEQSIETLNLHANLLCQIHDDGRVSAIKAEIQRRLGINNADQTSLACQPENIYWIC